MSADPEPALDPDVYRDAPEVVVKELLRTRWRVETALDPAIHHGWVRPGFDEPEVTVSEPEESPVRGGNTGFSGTAGDGSGPTKDMNGTVRVNTWADRSRVESNPKQVVYVMSREIERIIDSHATPEDTDLRFLSFLGGTRMPPETDKEPTMFRVRCVIGYGYHSRSGE